MTHGPRTDETIARDYTAMGHSRDRILSIVGGDDIVERSLEEKKEDVSRNVQHLEIMIDLPDWHADQDMSTMMTSIAAGFQYIDG